MGCLDWPAWRVAMEREYNGLVEKNAFHPVDCTPRMLVVTVRWVFAHKINPDGSIRWGSEKARLVARGFSQRPGDYNETYAPVARMVTVSIVFALTAFFDHFLFSFNITTAFLHSQPHEDVKIEQIPDFPTGRPGQVLLLLVTPYGLKQAAFTWYCHFMQVLVGLGFWRSELDHAFFVDVWTESPDPETIPMPTSGAPLRMFVPIHVDNGLVSTNSRPL